jgi:acetyl esterase/lipase
MPVAPPPQERDAIDLSGKTANPVAEEWDSLDTGLPPGAAPGSMGNFGGPELWVRNSSRATLTPFLPKSGKSTGAAMIVAPGGGFMQLAIDREGYSVARWLTQRGIAAFVLKYRLAPMPADQEAFLHAMTQIYSTVQENAERARASGTTLTLVELFPPEQRAALLAAREDGAEAVAYVRRHAAQWKLSPDRIGIMGFSAGAVTAIDVALTADEASRPDLVAPIYGSLSGEKSVPASAPPTFIAAAADDPFGRYSLDVYSAWRAKSVPAELHLFENGGHGFGVLRQGTSSDQWPELFDRWLRTHGFEK